MIEKIIYKKKLLALIVRRKYRKKKGITFSLLITEAMDFQMELLLKKEYISMLFLHLTSPTSFIKKSLKKILIINLL